LLLTFILYRPATFLASKFNPRMLILISPFLSIKEIVRSNYGDFASSLIREHFENKENIKQVKCPTFIIHG